MREMRHGAGSANSGAAEISRRTTPFIHHRDDLDSRAPPTRAKSGSNSAIKTRQRHARAAHGLDRSPYREDSSAHRRPQLEGLSSRASPSHGNSRPVHFLLYPREVRELPRLGRYTSRPTWT